jgi:hypothetical protein
MCLKLLLILKTFILNQINIYKENISKITDNDKKIMDQKFLNVKYFSNKQHKNYQQYVLKKNIVKLGSIYKISSQEILKIKNNNSIDIAKKIVKKNIENKKKKICQDLYDQIIEITNNS